MKRLSFLLGLLLSVPAFSQVSVPASSPEVTYIGRVQRTPEAVKADWSGTMAIIRFQGKTLSLDYADSGFSYVNLWLDKEPGVEADAVLKLTGSGTVQLAAFAKKGEHTVYLQKRTEGETGCISFVSFTTDGRLVPARGWKERVIEIIGDSYTCGFGVESPSRDAPPLFEQENCNKSYSGILGRFFDADVVRIAHSGRGVVRNYGDGDPGRTMLERYPCIFDDAGTDPWEVSYKPAIVVIYLGTNDFSEGKQPALRFWCAGYKKLLEQVRTLHGPSVPILCVGSNVDPLMADYVRWAVEAAGLPNVYYTSIQEGAHNITTEMGGAWHPNHSGMRKVAALMAPYISTLTGWDLPLKAIE